MTVVAAIAALFAAPAGAAPIYDLNPENPLAVLEREPAVDAALALSAYRAEEPQVGPRQDVQPPFMAWPSPGPLESPFAMRWGRMHEGIDIDGETGDPVTAAARGRVVFADDDQGYGLTVEIIHDGNFAGLRTRYSHLSAAQVEVGARVERGAPVGRIGTTGFVTGSHLHFEVHRRGEPIDPAGLLLVRDG